MAIPAGWSAEDWAGYTAAMPEACAWAARVQVMDLDHRMLATVPTVGLLEGQWNLVGDSGGTDANVDRTFTGQFYDAHGDLAAHLDPAVAPARLIQVRQSTFVESLGKWLHVDTFTGRPFVVGQPASRLYAIEAQGKDSFHNRGVSAGVFAKGAYVVDAIRNHLVSTGETLIDIPSNRVVTKRLAADVRFGGASDQMTPLAAMRRIASLADCQLYWTGGGVATVRLFPSKTVPLFTWDERTLLSEPEFSTDMSSMRNRWTGGGKGTLRADVSATGAYSPAALARKGVAWSHIEFGEDEESLTTTAQLVGRAQSRLGALVTLSTSTQASVVPFHAVDPLDVVAVKTPTRTELVTVRDCSVPVAGDWSSTAPAMSLGSVRDVRRGGYGSVRTSGTAAKPKAKRRRRR